jgi:hypothetical protein
MASTDKHNPLKQKFLWSLIIAKRSKSLRCAALEIKLPSWVQWLKTVILATWEAEIGRITVLKPAWIKSETLSPK